MHPLLDRIIAYLPQIHTDMRILIVNVHKIVLVASFLDKLRLCVGRVHIEQTKTIEAKNNTLFWCLCVCVFLPQPYCIMCNQTNQSHIRCMFVPKREQTARNQLDMRVRDENN